MSEHLRVVLDSSFELAEGPIWWRKGNALVWVDILEGDVYAFQEGSDWPQQWHLPAAVGCVVETMDGNLLAASAEGMFDVQTGKRIAEVPFNRDRLRPNDGKLDPFGNVVFGVMGYPDAGQGAGFLLRLRNGRFETLITDLQIPNGLVWLSSKELLFIDTPRQRIDRFSYYEDRPPEFIETYLDLSEFAGVPDGMHLHSDGTIFVAMWGGYQLLKIRSRNDIECILLPAERPTSVCSGPNRSELFVTTARSENGDGGQIFAVSF